MRIRLILSALLVVAYGAFRSIYPSQAHYIVQAQLAPQQVSNSNIQYGFFHFISSPDSLVFFMSLVLVTSLIVIWISYYVSRHEPKMKAGKMEKSLIVLLVLGGMALSGCKPYGATQIIEITPNETAFVVPLIGDSTAQAQFQSVEFLEDRQVAAKQVEIPVREHRLGRMPWDIEWLPTVAVIIVDRTPVTR